MACTLLCTFYFYIKSKRCFIIKIRYWKQGQRHGRLRWVNCPPDPAQNFPIFIYLFFILLYFMCVTVKGGDLIFETMINSGWVIELRWKPLQLHISKQNCRSGGATLSNNVHVHPFFLVCIYFHIFFKSQTQLIYHISSYLFLLL